MTKDMTDEEKRLFAALLTGAGRWLATVIRASRAENLDALEDEMPCVKKASDKVVASLSNFKGVL